VGIIKKVKDKRGGPAGKDSTAVTMPSMSYNPEKLAPVILSLWDDSLETLKRENDGTPTAHALRDAKRLINTAQTGLDLVRPVIITEEEHDNDWTMQDENEVVFVLPRRERAGNSANLLETAKLLMACTPNGI
jgi:hypothetical protein